MPDPAPATPSTRRVLVTGDMVMDHNIYQGQERRAGSTIWLGTLERRRPGGAALLHRLLSQIAWAAAGRKDLASFSVAFGLNRKEAERTATRGYCLFQPQSQDPSKKGDVWRLTQALGFELREPSLAGWAAADAVLNGIYDVLALDDGGIAFRRWPSKELWPRVLYERRLAPSWIVLKMSSPVAAGDLWHTLATGEAQELTRPADRQTVLLLQRTVAVMSINDLRVESIHVAKAFSWERAATDLARELRENTHLAGLRKCRFVVVSFDTDGALLADFSNPTAPVFRLIFDPSRLEGDFEGSLPGAVFGYQTCLTAAIVAHLPASADADSTRAALERGIQAGLCAMRQLAFSGHGPIPGRGACSVPEFPVKDVADEIIAQKHRWSYGAATVPADGPASANWTIVAGNAASAPLWGIARRVALRGQSELRQTPFLRYGKLFSVERSEIESLRGLHRLIVKYNDDPTAKKPLSIAVFGPPGAGKSFGVKQLAKAVLGNDVPLVEFNLSQFEDAEELIGLLHQVRDHVLGGKLPIIFWDEFDSGGLKWLQYLLAPMQDGQFQEGQITHPIGKCVFVFAGGTAHCFEDFGTPPKTLVDAGNKADLQKWEDEFRAKKGPDFKSRLAGYLNVIGPNKRDDQDATYPIRRAILLRVNLGLFGDEHLVIDDGLLTAFLEIDKYLHGARSVEKIAEPIRQSSRTGEFHRSDLPPRNQIAMHVNADKFLALVERNR